MDCGCSCGERDITLHASHAPQVTRDRLMLALHEQFPQYNFAGGSLPCSGLHGSLNMLSA